MGVSPVDFFILQSRCPLSPGAVRLTRDIPVRDHLVGQSGDAGVQDKEFEAEAGDDGDPDEVHTGRWVRWVMKTENGAGPRFMESRFCWDSSGMRDCVG